MTPHQALLLTLAALAQAAAEILMQSVKGGGSGH